jgi:hypothetical protein
LVGYWLKAEDVFNNFVMEPADFPSSFYWFRVVPDGSSNVIVEFTPVSTVISRGGNLEVDGSLYNLSPMRQSINFKTIVTTPNQNQKTLNNLNLSLAPLELKTKRLTYYIPPKAPLGTYTYSAIVSTVGGVELARDEFTFEVTD